MQRCAPPDAAAERSQTQVARAWTADYTSARPYLGKGSGRCEQIQKRLNAAIYYVPIAPICSPLAPTAAVLLAPTCGSAHRTERRQC
jgi:hypothetical protein